MASLVQVTRRKFLAVALRASAAALSCFGLTAMLGCRASASSENPSANSREPLRSRAEFPVFTSDGKAPYATLADVPWNLRLVNGAHPLPSDYVVPERAEFGVDGHTFDARAVDDLEAMLAAAHADGVALEVCSSFRSHEYQEKLFEKRVHRCEEEDGLEGEAAEEAAAFWVARPGASEHEAALALDLVDSDYPVLDEAQQTTAAQMWLADNCAQFGFILRYPTDKSALTGIGFEPWHYRYVGVEAAQDMASRGLCFEEWLAPFVEELSQEG